MILNKKWTWQFRLNSSRICLNCATAWFANSKIKDAKVGNIKMCDIAPSDLLSRLKRCGKWCSECRL